MAESRMPKAGGRSIAVTIAICVVAALASAPRPVLGANPGATIDGFHTVSWNFAPVGGPSGATDAFDLTVKLPAPDGTYYTPDQRQGFTHTGVLTVALTWTDSSPDQTLSISATDAKGNSVGDNTGGAVNDGSNINYLTIENPTSQKYTITASNFDGTSSSAIPSRAEATLSLVDMTTELQPAEPAGAPGF